MNASRKDSVRGEEPSTTELSINQFMENVSHIFDNRYQRQRLKEVHKRLTENDLVLTTILSEKMKETLGLPTLPSSKDLMAFIHFDEAGETHFSFVYTSSVLTPFKFICEHYFGKKIVSLQKQVYQLLYQKTKEMDDNFSGLPESDDSDEEGDEEDGCHHRDEKDARACEYHGQANGTRSEAKGNNQLVNGSVPYPLSSSKVPPIGQMTTATNLPLFENMLNSAVAQGTCGLKLRLVPKSSTNSGDMTQSYCDEWQQPDDRGSDSLASSQETSRIRPIRLTRKGAKYTMTDKGEEADSEDAGDEEEEEADRTIQTHRYEIAPTGSVLLGESTLNFDLTKVISMTSPISAPTVSGMVIPSQGQWLATSSGERVTSRRKRNKVPRYPCNICGKLFTARSHVKMHFVTHTGEKRFECPSCTKRFTQSSSLRNHVISAHTKKYPHQCLKCNKGFLLPSIVRKHMRSCRSAGKTS